MSRWTFIVLHFKKPGVQRDDQHVKIIDYFLNRMINEFTHIVRGYAKTKQILKMSIWISNCLIFDHKIISYLLLLLVSLSLKQNKKNNKQINTHTSAAMWYSYDKKNQYLFIIFNNINGFLFSFLDCLQIHLFWIIANISI